MLRGMSPVSAIALSGMKAATLRFTAAASNIANARSNGPLPGAAAGYPPAYHPLRVVQMPADGGGTLARIESYPTDIVTTYDPHAPYANDAGMVAAPDVDLVEETLQLITARNEFAANLLVLRIDAQMSAGLLDIKA